MNETVISLKNVSKCFKRYARPVDRLKEILLPAKSRADEFWALQDINLEVLKGQTLGLVGRNGSGKSTLLQIIAGTLTPTAGEVRVNGRVSALLELGSGFNPEFTGRQNVFFNGRLLGLSHKETEDKFDEIASFADIGDFIEQPVKTYSSGMFVRLAFAVAVNVEPEVLIVDEALAVGDIVFQHRCMRRMRTLMESGVTTLFVSHDPVAIKTLCNSAVLIHEGKISTSGLPNAVIIEYMKMVTEQESGLVQAEVEQQSYSQANNDTTQQNNSLASDQAEVLSNRRFQNKVKSTRRGNRKALIEDVRLLNSFGEYSKESPIFRFNEQVTLIVDLKAYESLNDCIVGFFVCDKNGIEILGSNTFEENFSIGKLAAGDKINIQFQFSLPLRSSSYSLTVAGAEDYSSVISTTFDWIDNALVFQVLPPDTGKLITAIVDQPMVVNAIKETLPNVAFQVQV